MSSAEDHARAIERAQKLLRLAAPGNGTTEAERTNAALKAAEIIAEHNLVVAIPPPRVKRRRPPTAQPTQQRASSPSVNEWRQWAPSSTSDWTEVDIPAHCNCVVCGGLLCVGEVGWFAPNHGYRHYDITCEENR
jgi:hypothetical protein